MGIEEFKDKSKNKKVKAFIVLIAIIGILFISLPAKAGTIAGDSYVWDQNPTTNYGNTNPLSIGSGAGFGNQYIYLDFGAYYNNANLTMYCSTGPNCDTAGAIYMDFYSTTAFNEGTITWNNKPALGTKINSHQRLTTGFNTYIFSGTNRYVVMVTNTTWNVFEAIQSRTGSPAIVINSNPIPIITSWSNTKTNNDTLTLYVHPAEGVIFNVSANQPVTTYTWLLDNLDQNTNASSIFVSAWGTGNHTLNASVTNSNGTSFSVNWTINSSYSNLPANGFDPSGYVLDASNNPLQNAKVVLYNSTFTATTAYSNSLGFWNTNIFSNGTYNFNVSKQGFTTLTGSQAFTIGGVNNNFTLTASQGLVTGHVYTNISGTGTTAIKGQLQDLRVDSCGLATQGGTLTIGESGDGSTYVLKLLDVDSGNQQSIWVLLKDGSALYNNQIVNVNEPLQLKIYETIYETVYVDIRVSNVFQGSSGEFNTATTCGSFEHVSKSVSILDFLLNLVQDLVVALSFTGTSGATVTAFNDVMLSTDGSNQNAVTFNSTAGNDAVGYADFTVNNPATIFNFNIALTAESTTASAGKLEIGYTDDVLSQDNGFTDVIFINTKQTCQANGNGYCTPQHDFKAVDANSNGKIRVWFKFDSGYSNFKLYEFYLNAWGTTAQIPLQGVNVYTTTGNQTLTDSLGFYNLYVTLGTRTVYYTKIGYESKNYTLTLNNSVPIVTQDVILNSTNATVNTTKEYIIVPNFVQGVATNGNFKTLGHTSLIGGYQIAICPQLGQDCTIQDVSANTEGTFALDQNLAVGTYEADLTGYLGGLLDITREVIVSTNFTVTSSDPHVNWGTNPYNLGEKMILSVYVPTGSKNVTVVYLTNGTQIYSNAFSATGTVQNTSFQTNTNFSLTAYPPGQYQGCIEGGNCDTTTLLNQSMNAYNLSSPSNVLWGGKFNIIYNAPRTAILQVTNQSNDILISESVIGTRTRTFNTAALSNQNDVLRIELIRDSQVVANSTTLITTNPNPSGGGVPTGNQAATNWGNNLITLMSQIAFWGIIFFIIVVWVTATKAPQALGIVSFITVNLEGATGLFAPYTLYVLALAWIAAGIFFTVGRKATTHEG